MTNVGRVTVPFIRMDLKQMKCRCPLWIKSGQFANLGQFDFYFSGNKPIDGLNEISQVKIVAIHQNLPALVRA